MRSTASQCRCGQRVAGIAGMGREAQRSGESRVGRLLGILDLSPSQRLRPIAFLAILGTLLMLSAAGVVAAFDLWLKGAVLPVDLLIGALTGLLIGPLFVYVPLRLARRNERLKNELDALNQRLSSEARSLRVLSAELSRANRQLQFSQTVAGISYYELDLDSGVFTGSPELPTLLPSSPVARLTLPGVLSRLHPEDRGQFSSLIERCRRDHASGHQDFRVRGPDGIEHWLHIYGEFVAGNDDAPGSMVGVIQDITELRQALAREQELNEMKSRFVAMTSHEFRTPMTAILSSTEMLEAYGERLGSEKTAKLYGMIKTAVANMTSLLEEVLFIGKADTGHLAFKPSAMVIDGFCEGLLHEIRTGIGINHRIAYSPLGDTRTDCVDPQLLRQILTNLVSNAIKFSPRDSQVTLTAERDGNHLVFEVTDQGLGIPPEDQRDLFSTFHRARNVNNIQGTGLGLAIVRQCVELHGGDISFQSELGRGSVFRVRISIEGESGE
ncbi:PAS domain-containing sensor histidine kinase [Methylolobus aquaticus]